MPATKRSFNWKLIVCILVAFLLGGAVWPAYSLASDVYAEYQFGKTYQEDIRYRVAEQIEAYDQDFFVLGIEENDQYVSLWLYFDATKFPTELETTCELYGYVLGRMLQIADVLYAYYPDRAVYYAFIAYNLEVSSLNGPVNVFPGGQAFNLSPEWVDFISEGLADETVCPATIMQMMMYYGGYANASFINLGYFTGEILDRGPGYVYPWTS